MRIALVYPEVHRRGGVERVALEAAGYLRHRHEVTVVCRRGGAEDIPEGVRLVEVASRPQPSTLAMLDFHRQAAATLRGLEPDRSVAFGSDCPSADLMAVQSVHRAWVERGRSVRVAGQEVPASVRRALPRHQVRLLLERRAFSPSRATRFIAVAEGVADDLEALYGVDRQRISVVPNGYDPQQCSPERRAALRAAARAAAGIGPDETVLLLVANEWHRKGLGVLLDALAALNDPGTTVALVGRAPLGPYEGRIGALGLRNRVRHLGPRSDIAEAYALADLFVLPTQYEAFGIVIVEALACGVPVVTTALAGAAELVRPGVNGLLQHDPDDPGELAGLLRTATHGDNLARWADAAPATVTDYTWSAVMKRFEQAIVGGRPEGRVTPRPPQKDA